ncbi:hypothetical protein [Luteimicrobium subarcticum]|uniref:Uncharacterized protein n=1 Tax=Luteimicrobium subarcticum TaxID=620910 RepID=A0A2M8WRJ0_9MICO|nr:hypothetical protein [Luteimicrobium subarcticum]PJI93542.1 hypothetical protein CLV34_2116 [Luteimicrobium subarcticum]
MDETVSAAERSGLTVTGSYGSAEDVWSVWRAFVVVSAIPARRIPDTDDGTEMRRLQEAWLDSARTAGVVSSTGEFLLSVQSSTAIGPWTRVRLGVDFDISGLGLTWAVPEFVASDVDRTVSIGVSTEEDDYQIFVSRTDPVTGATDVPDGSSL